MGKKIRKNKARYQDSFESTIDDTIDRKVDDLHEHAGGMGTYIGDACLRYSTEHSMMVPTSASYNVFNPSIPKCGYSEKCDYRTEKDKDNKRYCGYYESKMSNYWRTG